MNLFSFFILIRFVLINFFQRRQRICPLPRQSEEQMRLKLGETYVIQEKLIKASKHVYFLTWLEYVEEIQQIEDAETLQPSRKTTPVSSSQNKSCHN